MPEGSAIVVRERVRGKVPLGALVWLPLFAMPLGGYIVQQRGEQLGVCTLKAVLGLPCMTCGATRGTMRLLYGDVVAAVLFQPMMMLVYLAVGIWGAVSFGAFLLDRRVEIRLSDGASLAFKVTLGMIPVLNWGYLWWVGV